MTARIHLLGMLLTLAPCALIASGLEMPAIFGNGMVLQRDVTLPVWGKAAAGAEVVVTLADGLAKTVADMQGNWRVELPARPAGGPVAMSITAGEVARQFADVLIGDVWICSGGAGMDSTAGNAADLRALVTEPPPGVRIAMVPGQIASRPAPAMRPMQWVPAGMSHGVASFSAAAVAFALESRRLADPDGIIPIGLIQATSANSLTASWAGREALEGDPLTRPVMERYDAAVAAYLEASRDYIPKFTAWVEGMALAEASGTPFPSVPPMPPEPRSDPLKPCGYFYGMITPLAPYAVKGVLWNHGELDVAQPDLHTRVFSALVQSWRNAWQRPDLPFIVAELGPPENDARAAFRNAQAGIRIPDTRLVRTRDLERIKPVTIGRRMAAAATQP